MQNGKVREMRVMRQYYSSLNNRHSFGVRTPFYIAQACKA